MSQHFRLLKIHLLVSTDTFSLLNFHSGIFYLKFAYLNFSLIICFFQLIQITICLEPTVPTADLLSTTFKRQRLSTQRPSTQQPSMKRRRKQRSSIKPHTAVRSADAGSMDHLNQVPHTPLRTQGVSSNQCQEVNCTPMHYDTILNVPTGRHTAQLREMEPTPNEDAAVSVSVPQTRQNPPPLHPTSDRAADISSVNNNNTNFQPPVSDRALVPFYQEPHLDRHRYPANDIMPQESFGPYNLSTFVADLH